MKKLALILFGICCVFGLAAQDLERATHYNAWYTFSGKHVLGKEWNLHTFAQVRRNQILLHWQQSYLQLALSKNVSKKVNLAVGSGWVHFFPYGDFRAKYSFNELRVWEQISFKTKLNKLLIHNRLRWEHRYLERKYAHSDGEYAFDYFMYKNRFRYRLLLKYPIKKIHIVLSNEGFLDLGKNTFDHISQNRFIGTIEKSLGKNIKGNFGYMYQHIWKGKDRSKLETNHTLLLGISYTLK